jgi:hypothetical protein
MKKIINYIKNLKIDFQRWMFRRRSNHHAERQQKMIRKADKLSKKYKKRLWVITIERGSFLICSKPEMKKVMQQIPALLRINMYQTNDYIVHITQKTNENN